MCHNKLRTLVPTLLVTLLVGLPVAAQLDSELSKKDQKWLDEEAGAIITAQEIKIYTDIDKDDRKLFKEIFWSRRDPNPATKDNEFEKGFEAKMKQADKQYKAKGMKGSATDMGKIFCLLGAPSRVDGNAQAANWVYDPNPQLGIPDGLTIEFQANQMVQSEDLEKALERVRTRNIVNPTVMYTRDMEGRLLEPRASIDLNSPANQILRALRETQTTSADVPFESTIAFFRATEGSVYIPILFEVDEAPLTWQGDTADLTVFGSVENADGYVISQFEEPAKVTKTSDGRTLFEVPIQLVPGPYKLYLGVRDNPSTTAGTQITEIQVPDYFSSELVMSSVVVYNEGKEVEETAGTPGQAFQFGKVKFQPANKYTKQNFIGLFFFIYGLGVDESGKPDITGQYSFYRGSTKKGQTGTENLPADANQAVGNAEIPLSIPNFDEPGDWRMHIEVTDKVLNKTLTQDVEFVLLGETGTQ